MPRTQSSGDLPVNGGPRLSRRHFLVGSGVVPSAGVLGLPFLHHQTNRLRPRLDASAATGQLNGSELATLMALLDVIIAEPMHETSDAMALVVTRATQRVPGVLKEYRMGAELLESTARRRSLASFASATRPDRGAVVEAILWQFPALAGPSIADVAGRALVRLDRLVLNGPARRFRELVVRDLLARYYRRYAWNLLPYDNVPGRAGPPRAYTEVPASQEPPGGPG
jgi:hypothetical protein